MGRTKKKLDKQEKTIKARFTMAEPNDDLHAFAWSMDRLRYPAKDSKPNDVWPGPSIFGVPESDAHRNTYGYNVTFLNPTYLQFMLDQVPSVRAAAEKCAADKYTPEAIAELRKVVMAAFRDVVLPDMATRFKKIAGLVAEFYAARLAHIETFGFNDEE